jgi:crossover junction endodeoxyribonuclease RusA
MFTPEAHPEQTISPAGPMRFDIALPWNRPPLHSNQNLIRQQEARITSEVRLAVGLLARRIPNLGRCEVTLTWYVNDHRRRDEDNLNPTLKVCCDALVDVGVVADDIPRLMTKHMSRIVFMPKTTMAAHMVLTVTTINPIGVAA